MSEEAIKGVLQGLVDSFEVESRKSAPYINLFKACEEGSYQSFLRELHHGMEGLVLDAMLVLEDNGLKPSNETYDILLALPYLSKHLEDEIIKKQGISCCVDKSFFELSKKLNESFKEKDNDK